MASTRFYRPLGLYTGLLCALVASSFALSATPTLELAPRITAELDAELERRGYTRVIVKLAAADEPLANTTPGLLDSPATVKARQESISNLQDQLSEDMAGVRSPRRYRNFPLLTMEIDRTQLAQLRQHPAIAQISRDGLSRPSLNFSVPHIGATRAWLNGYSGLGQAVAILDTGVDSSHPFLAGKVIAEACFSTTSGTLSSSVCPTGEDPGGNDQQIGPGAGIPCNVNNECQHGTHVAGIVAGDSSTSRGVAPNAELIAVQVFSRITDVAFCGPSPCVATWDSDLLRAFDWLYDNRNTYAIASINMSLGGGAYTSTADCDADRPAFRTPVSRLRSAGITVVAASGNESQTGAISAPACVTGVISVGATTDIDEVAPFSNSAPALTLLAPGTGISSSLPGGGFSSWNGTSMAAPHVAGTVAILRSAAPQATVAELEAALAGTGVAVTDMRNGLTRPRIQVDAAVARLAGGHVETDVMLVTGTPDPGQYGNNYGSNEHYATLTVGFENSTEDLLLSVTGYDIDYADEISVFLNEQPLGFLSTGPNNGVNAGDTFPIPAIAQEPGTNIILFAQRNPGWIWGVSSLLLDVQSTPPAVGFEITLIPGTPDLGQYGSGYGSDQHETEVAFNFVNTGSDLIFSVTGYDVDNNNELAVFFNGSPLGFLSKGSNNGNNGGDTFAIPVVSQSPTNNVILIQQQTPGWTWGVTNLLLQESQPDTEEGLILVPGEIATGQYGHRYGTNENYTDLAASFQGTGTDLVLSVTGYDIDFDDEALVYLNGVPLDYLRKGQNNSLNSGDSFAIPASLQLAGTNQILFQQTTAGWKWGVTNLLLQESQSNTEEGLTLVPGTVETGQYGHRYGTNENYTDLAASFQGTGADLVLSVTGYDIDFDDEVLVYLNGVPLDYLSEGQNNSLNSGDSFAIPASSQLAGTNEILFQQTTAGWKWGVTEILLTP